MPENDLELVAAASPPDVRYRLENQADHELDFIRCGFAAGCEAPVLKIKPIIELDSIRCGFAAGCEAPVLKIKPIIELDSIRSGFAAGCEVPS